MDPFPPIVSVTLRKCPSDRSISTVGSKPILCPAHVPDLIEVRNASFKEFLFFFLGTGYGKKPWKHYLTRYSDGTLICQTGYGSIIFGRRSCQWSYYCLWRNGWADNPGNFVQAYFLLRGGRLRWGNQWPDLEISKNIYIYLCNSTRVPSYNNDHIIKFDPGDPQVTNKQRMKQRRILRADEMRSL